MVVKTEIAYVPGEWNSSVEFDAWLVESVRNDDQSETFVNFVIEHGVVISPTTVLASISDPNAPVVLAGFYNLDNLNDRFASAAPGTFPDSG
jgi:hypothetical protein